MSIYGSVLKDLSSYLVRFLWLFKPDKRFLQALIEQTFFMEAVHFLKMNSLILDE